VEALRYIHSDSERLAAGPTKRQTVDATLSAVEWHTETVQCSKYNVHTHIHALKKEKNRKVTALASRPFKVLSMTASIAGILTETLMQHVPAK
jgi:SOS-response transcriptional repressor LexA